MKKTLSKLYTFICLTLCSIFSSSVLADLPTMDTPSRGEGRGLMETIKNYSYDGVILMGLLIGSYAFTKVAGAALETFGEVRSGKKTWGDFAMIVLVGVCLLVVVIWLLTQAADIL